MLSPRQWLTTPSVTTWYQPLSPRGKSPLSPRLMASAAPDAKAEQAQSTAAKTVPEGPAAPAAAPEVMYAVATAAAAQPDATEDRRDSFSNFGQPAAQDGRERLLRHHEGRKRSREQAREARRASDAARQSRKDLEEVLSSNEDPDEAALKKRSAQVFRRLDLNQDGVITLEELMESLAKLDSENWEDANRVRRLFKAMDANGDSVVTPDELQDWFISSGPWEEVRDESPAFAATMFEVAGGSLTDSYELGEKVGEGSFGSVNRAVQKSAGTEMAVKSLRKTKVDTKILNAEVVLMKRLRHKHILRLFDVFEDEFYFYLILELCSGGDLFDRIVEQKALAERTAANVMRQLMWALCYMHSNFICHRDLKPENFLLQANGPIDDGCIIKVTDFGLACKFDPDEPMTQRVGTSYYISPQVLHGCYDQSCDLWSSGVTMFMMLVGYPPFGGETENETYEIVLKGEYAFAGAASGQVSQDAQDLVSHLILYDPGLRYGPEDALEHSWIQNYAPDVSYV